MPARTAEQTAALFDGWAASYDADLRAAGSFGPLTGYDTSLNIAAEQIALAVPVGSTVLDIGTGTGALARRMIDRHQDSNTLRLTGIDPSARMRAQTARRHPDISVLPGDFLALPDDVPATGGQTGWAAIISSFAFHEVAPANRQRALTGVLAALAPNGVLALLDVMFASPAALADAERTTADWDPTETYHLVGDLDALLKTTGLSDTRWWQTAPMHWLVIARQLG